MAKGSDPLNAVDRLSIAGIHSRRWLGRVGRRVLRPGSLATGAVVVAYGVLQLLASHEAPSKDAWETGETLWWLLIGTGVVALVGTFLVFAGYARLLKKLDQNDELYEGCRAVWRLAVDRLGIDMKKVGVHVWGVRGLPGCRYLERRATFVIEPRRATHVIWRKGKGAIGLAWDEDDALVANIEGLDQRLDIEGLDQRLDDRARSEQAFCEIPKRERFGLSWREFRHARRYRAVLAVPLRVRGKVRGCLSVDVLVDGHANSLDTLLQDDRLNAVLTVCEAVLGGKR